MNVLSKNRHIISTIIVWLSLSLFNSACGLDVSAIVDEVDADMIDGDINGDLPPGTGDGTGDTDNDLTRPLDPGELPPDGLCVQARWLAIEAGDTSCTLPLQVIDQIVFSGVALDITLSEVGNGVYPVLSELQYKRDRFLQRREDDAGRPFPCECNGDRCVCSTPPGSRARYSLTPVDEATAQNSELSLASFVMTNPVCKRSVAYERRFFAVACNVIPAPIDPIFDPLKFPTIWEIYFVK